MGLGDILGKVGSAIEAGSDLIGVDHIGHALDTVGEKTQFNSGASIIGHEVKRDYTFLRNNINRTITTGLLADDLDPRNEWRAAKNISPGQAFVAALHGSTQQLKIDDLGPFSARVRGVPENFDVGDPAQRQETFSHGSAMVLSGTADATLSWFADPTVIGGKLAAAGKTAVLTRPLKLGKLDEAGATAKLDKVVGDPHEPGMPAGKRLEAYAKHYFPPGETAEARRVRLVSDPNFKGNIATAEFLARANDPLEFKLRMRVAMDPSNRNRQFMEAYSKQANEEFDRLHDTSVGLEAALDDTLMDLQAAMEIGDDSLISEVRDQMVREGRRVDVARKELQRASDDAGDALLAKQSVGQITEVPRVRTSQRLEQVYKNHSGASWAVYQPSRYSAVRVLRSAASTRVGMVIHDQPNSAIEQVGRMFDRAGHGARARGNKGISDEVREFHINAVSRAAYGGSIPDLQKAIHNAESAAITHVAQLQGIAPKVAELLYADLRERRTTTLKTILSGGQRNADAAAELDAAGQVISTPRAEGTFSGATRDGHRADQFLMPDGTWISSPLSVSGLENATPLIDLDIVTRMLRREKYTLTDPDEASLLARMQHKTLGMGGLGSQAADVTRWGLENINRAWKPAQLFRLGWPVRVVTDENLRSMASIGALAHIRLSYGESLGNSVRHGFTNLAGKSRARIALRKVAEGEGERGQIVGDLVDLTGRKMTLAADAQRIEAKIAAGAGAHRYADELDDIATQQLEDAAYMAELTGRHDDLSAWIEGMKARADRLGDRTPAGKFNGTITLTKNGVHVERPDAFAGAFGRLFMDLSSAASTTRALANTSEQALNGMRVAGGDTATLTAKLPEPGTATKQKIALLRSTYNNGWEQAVNRQIGQDVMLRQIVEGKSNDEILAWMSETTAGQEYVRKMAAVPRARREEWVLNARAHVEQYLPDENLKALVLDGGRATAADLRRANKAKGLTDEDLPIIHAQSLDLITGVNPLDHLFSSVVDKAYAKIGTAPTDVLSRQPFFASIYRREMQSGFEGLQVTHADEVSEATWAELERSARQTALREVKRTMYDVANESNLAHTMRFVLPFYAAWQDALQTWGRIWTNDPSTLAHLNQIWQAPQKTNLIYENSDGKKFMAIPLPKEVREKLGLSEDMGMPANWMRDLIFQGEYWYNPGVGVPVAVPLAMAVRDRPSLETTLKPLLPYGAGDSVWDQLLPAGWQKGKSLWNETDDEDYAKAQFRLFQDVYTENRVQDKGMTNIEMWDEAKRRTDALLTVRMASNFALPFAPNIRSPYQLYIDQWRSIQEQYRQDPNAFGGKSAQDQFIDQWGEDYFVFTLAATKSNVGGIAPTVEGFKGFTQYRDLVREMPEMGSLIVGDVAGDYSSATAEWMLKEGIGGGDSTKLRTIRDPKQGIIDGETNMGWTRFRAIDDATDAAMAERGLTSLRSKGAADIKALRDGLIAKVKKDFPSWADEFGNIDRGKADKRALFMEKLVDDPRMIERPGFRSLAQYLAARQLVVTELAGRTSHNLQAQSNSDLLAVFEAITNGLRKNDLDFATLHTRWLSSDNLTTGGVV